MYMYYIYSRFVVHVPLTLYMFDTPISVFFESTGSWLPTYQISD